MQLSALLGGCWAVLAATAWQVQQPALWPMAVYIGMMGVGVCGLLGLYRWRHRTRMWPRRMAAVLALTCALCAAGQAGWRACARHAQMLPAALEGQTLRAHGVVLSMPQRVEQGVRLRWRIESLQTLEGRPVADAHLPRTVLLGWYGPGQAVAEDDAVGTAAIPALQVGERWQFALRMKAPHGLVNPHGFDYELWLWEQGITATGHVRTQEFTPRRLSPAPWPDVEALRQSWRDAVFREVAEPRWAGVIAALTLGDQAAIGPRDWQLFRATGVAHLMAISGLHITGLAWWMAACIDWLWRRIRWRRRSLALWWPAPLAARVACVFAAVSYAALTGWGVPAQRTVGMLALAQVLALRGRSWPWPLGWSVMAAVLVLCDPWALLQAGFWLSFVAVGVLFVGAPSVVSPVDAPAASGAMHRWRQLGLAARRLWREQLLMSLCLAPLSLLLFQQVSLVGLLANLIAVPWVTLVVTPLCLLGVVWSGGWTAATWALQALMPLLQWMAAWPAAQWSAPAVPTWVGAAALLGGVWLALPWPWYWRLTGLGWLLPLLSWQVPRPLEGRFVLLAADIGQGQAVLLRTQHHDLLYDTGPRYGRESDAGQRVLLPLLRAFDVQLDRVVLSHADSDHSGGLHSVLAAQPQADLLTSVAPDHPLRQGHHSGTCVQGMRWVWDGVRFEILHPAAGDEARAGSENARSCVLRVTDAHGVSALLAGDIEAAQEARLLAQGQNLRADWLLVPHHGSNTSSTPAFVQAVQAHWALVQAGYRNRFGHPRAQVVARYVAIGSRVVQTPSCGAAHWQSDRPDDLQCERIVTPHYWRHVMSP